ncbi:MAG: hypothetical protein IJZ08_00845 [Clostridia bacterium]|nr:hypothetical protein [Clostridia bacterium]
MNTVYENSVLETKLTELFNSKLAVRSLMTVDDSLKEGAGLTKIINRYTYNGTVEALAGGQSNSAAGTLTFTPETYTVKRYQQTFRYNDVEAMQDPALIDAALAGAADVMANQVRSEYFAQLAHIKNRRAFSGKSLTYSDIVEALGDIGREVEQGLFILMGADGRTAIRKDPDFIAAQQGEILYSGQFGTLCGIPVLFSRLVPAGKVIITDKAAVKFFVKKEASLEQSRDIETKENTIVYERHGLIALVDDTSSVILGTAAPALTASANAADGAVTLTVSGASGTVRYLADADAPLLADDVSHWAIWDGASPIEIGDANRIAVAETDTDGLVIKSAVITL